MIKRKVKVIVMKEDVGYSATSTIRNDFVGTEAETFEELKIRMIEALNVAYEEREIEYTLSDPHFPYLQCMQTVSLYRRIWERLFPKKWVLGLFLIFLFGIPRFMLVLNSYESGQSQWVSIVFTLMFFTPLIFLKKAGRGEMGIRRSTHPWWLLWGFLLGCGMCLLLFAINRLLFGLEISNPFVYIGSGTTNSDGSMIYFLIYMIIIMTFSPIGEELFYRGVVHQAFKGELGDRKAAVIDSAAFALTHLAHFGIVFTALGWKFLPGPALLWLCAMFFTCLVFNRVRQECGSILGAILTHAGFNFGMGFIIFYAL